MTTHDPLTPPGAGEAQPLTSAEMRSVATALASKHLHLDKPECDEFRLATAVLATLDTARATQPAGLREALRKAAERHHGLADGDHQFVASFMECPNYVCRDARAALATTSAGDADGHESWCPVAVLLAKDKPVCQCRSRAASVDDEETRRTLSANCEAGDHDACASMVENPNSLDRCQCACGHPA